MHFFLILLTQTKTKITASKPFFLRKDTIVFLSLTITGYIIILFIFLVFEPAPLANILGFLSLFCYVSTIIPSIVKVTFPATQKSKTLKWLLKNRRKTGVADFNFGLSHSVLLINETNLNLLEYRTYIHSSHGISILLIFTLLALTSNN